MKYLLIIVLISCNKKLDPDRKDYGEIEIKPSNGLLLTHTDSLFMEIDSLNKAATEQIKKIDSTKKYHYKQI